MIRVMFLYPKTDESTFDMDYYTSTHMPMLAAALGDDCQSWGADKITSGPYEAIGWALVSSAEAFGAAMTEKGAEIRDDVANYTNVRPDVVMGDVVR
ncbi:EthD family reductase [Actinomadura sp. 7K507]|uniref:EthD family reductase n=1 Tax=Actinomadura sp. 7K507 TaxID=2530365 RepID=UPI00104DC733|nr:EthD family reductase [Actinomadura sp. 7K507]TDC89946.1 EthD family reductase [Actinomadura sp. 7K507]